MNRIESNPARGVINGWIASIVIWAMLGTLIVAWCGGCQAQGSWDLHGEVFGNKWSVGMTNVPPKPDDKPVIQTFDDWFQHWWEALWQEPAQALAPPPDHLVVTSLEKKP